MVVRIRLNVGPQIAAQRKLDARLALAVASLLTPASLMCVVVALWAVLADTQVTQQFMISEGLLSHWQVWLAAGVLIQMLSAALDRYGKRHLAEQPVLEGPERG